MEITIRELKKIYLELKICYNRRDWKLEVRPGVWELGPDLWHEFLGEHGIQACVRPVNPSGSLWEAERGKVILPDPMYRGGVGIPSFFESGCKSLIMSNETAEKILVLGL